MKKRYGISWDGVGSKYFGTLEVECDLSEAGAFDSMEDWGEQKLKDYVQGVLDGNIKSNDSLLAYCVAYNFVYPEMVRKLSVFRMVHDRSEIENDIDAKTKEKIQKLLNLAMSDNENEAKLASQMAYRLMKKNSLTRSEVDGQEFLCLKMQPKGKRVSTWEKYLYSYVASTAGVFLAHRSGHDGNDREPSQDAVLMLTGRERDVLNAAYLIECYIREIEALVKKRKKALGMSTKEANDYRLGLISGVGLKLKRDKEQFFAETREEFHEVVSVDTRIEEAQNLFKAKRSATRVRQVGASFSTGKKDAEKIVISKAAEDKTQQRKRLGA